MTLRSWTSKLFSRPTRKAPVRCRPALEALEDRALPSVNFKPAVNYFVGVKPSDVAVGDFTGDGKQDLATANYLGDRVSVLKGNGDGTFQDPVKFGTGDGPIAVAVGDFTGDGKQDLATANFRIRTVSVLLNNKA